MPNNKKILLAGLLSMAALLGTASPGHADPITENGFFTSDHCSGGCLSKPGTPTQAYAGTISVTQDGLGTGGAVGTLTFNLQLVNGNVFIGSGLDASFAFNLIGNPQITYSALTYNLGA